jgi:uncharacterized membrane protein YccC
MLRYVAIGAVVGFLLAVLLISRKETPPPEAAAPAATARSSGLVEAPAALRQRAMEGEPSAFARHAPTVLSQRPDAG